MRKQILLFMCLAAFPLFAQQDEINIQVDAPDNVVAGNNFEVTVTFVKGELKDYSRFSQDLPAGFTAENISSPNADFSFDEQRVRVIWLKLPDEPEVKVTYSVSSHERVSGTLELGGTFAYVDEGERAYLNIVDTKKVTVMPNPNIDQSLVVDIADFNTINESDNAVSVEEEAQHFASVVRQLPQVEPNGIVNVSLLVKRPEGTNFLKLEESIPGGYSFEALDVHGAVVSHAAQLAKFVWMKPPADNNFLVKYRLVPILEKTQEPLVIDGNLTFTDGGETKVAGAKEMDVNLLAMNSAQQAELLDKGTVPAGLEHVAQVNTNTNQDQVNSQVNHQAQNQVSNQPVDNNQSSTTSGSSRNANTYSKSAGGSIINVANLEAAGGVYFRVQVAAVRKTYFANVFFADYDLLRDVKQEKLEGWTKYTVGSFNTYEEANSHKSRVIAETPIGKAFVVAYRDGQRVSIASVR